MSKKKVLRISYPHGSSSENHKLSHEHEAIFLSDLHLGTKSAQTKRLADFLEQVNTRHLYLVGDIIDFWNLSTINQHWSKSHTRVLKSIAKMIKNGTKVTYVPGNHDEVLRDITPLVFPDFRIVKEDIFEFRNKRYLVIHGDAFDHMLKVAKPLYVIGGMVYDFLVSFNRLFNMVRKLFGLPYWSLSMYLKHRAKESVGLMQRYKGLALQYAHRQGCQGVVCGHIHNPEADLDNDYFNCGDGVENLTFIGVTSKGGFYLGSYAIDTDEVDSAENVPSV